MNYIFATINLKSDISLPPEYNVFANENPDGKCDIKIEKVLTKPNLDLYKKRAELSLVNVLQNGNHWLFESVNHDGFLSVSDNYSLGEFYCENEDYADILRPLLQAMVECKLVMSGIMVLHCACICKDGKAICFSAPSGTGKSSRASLWEEHLGATWLSGDRPAVDVLKGIAYGVPWDGKEQHFVNTSAPIQAIVEIHRSGKTFARKMTVMQKTNFLAKQMFVPMCDPVLIQKVFSEIKNAVNNIPIYKLFCNISKESTIDSYDLLYNNQKNILEEKEENFMKLKEGFEIVEIAGDYMAVPVGDNMATYGGTVVLNEVSAFLLNSMKENVTEEELLHLLINEYEIDEATASADLKDILATFKNIDLID